MMTLAQKMVATMNGEQVVKAVVKTVVALKAPGSKAKRTAQHNMLKALKERALALGLGRVAAEAGY